MLIPKAQRKDARSIETKERRGCLKVAILLGSRTVVWVEENTAEHSYVLGAITAQLREHKISARRKEKHGELLLFEFKAICERVEILKNGCFPTEVLNMEMRPSLATRGIVHRRLA